MRLYDVPEGSKLKVMVTGIKDGKYVEKEQIVTFHHIDGMYSYITTDDGETLHLAAITPMKKVGDYYQIKEEDEET